MARYRIMQRPVNGSDAKRPAVTGTLNQTGMDDEAASTFDVYVDAEDALELVQAEMGDQYAVWIEEG